MYTSSFIALLDRNEVFTGQFAAGDLPSRPRMPTILLTCLDARVDPAHIFGLALGDAYVIRNAGGRVTPGVIQDLGVLGVLASNMPGASFRQLELVVIHHSDCGMSRLVNPAMQEQLAAKLGVSIDEVAGMAITDPATSVREDLERLRAIPGAPDQLVVSGLVYDVRNGTLSQVEPPTPLGANT